MNLASDIMQQALRRMAPMEACGVVLHDGTVLEITNLADGPGKFVMDVGEYTAAYHRGIRAIWHTHPNGNTRMSSADIAGHDWAVDMLIVTESGVFWYAMANNGS